MNFKEGNFLIVDDYQAVRDMIKKDLITLGFSGNLIEADSALKAVEMIKKVEDKVTIHFIISDWEMENGNGIDLLQYMRNTEKFKKTPFLMLSSVGKKEIVLAAIKAGVSDYLLKPWEKEQLESKIRICWNKTYN